MTQSAAGGRIDGVTRRARPVASGAWRPHDARVTTGASDTEDAGFGELGEIVGFHIRLAHGAAYRHFMETFAQLELTQKQVSVLWLVADNPGIGQSALARRLQMDRATVMAIVNRLEARGLVLREDHGQDARRRALKLGEQGRAALDQAKIAIAEHERWLTARYSKREVRQLIDLLSRIHG
jgi:DNA-binding MarR family transcriptional regulator